MPLKLLFAPGQWEALEDGVETSQSRHSTQECVRVRAPRQPHKRLYSA